MTTTSFPKLLSIFFARQDSELHQACVRWIFSAAFFALIFLMDYYETPGEVSHYALITVSIFVITSSGILLSAAHSPQASSRRRIAGIVIDILCATALLISGGAAGSIAFGAYLWVTIANGLRYGHRYLVIAHLSSMAAFCLVLLFSEYWRQNLILGISLLIWLFLLPIYVSSLLRKLEESVHRAETANKAKSAFLANMSHEIRTPLTAIIGYAEASLDGGQSSEERNTALQTIMRSGKHLLQLINDILDFSKIEADRLDLEYSTVDPFRLLADVIALIKPKMEKKGLTLSVNYEFPMPVLITTDPLRLQQILLNICSNAVKFTAQGTISLTASCDWNNQQLSFAITDTGIGMTAEQMAGLFLPFRQADSSTTRRYGGTGLGLSLSKHLAEKLGGAIEAHSEFGQGSVFTLRVATGPLNNVDRVYAVPQIQALRRQEAMVSQKNRLSGTILLAEDNPTIQKLLTLFLRKMGATVTIVDSGDAALRAAQQKFYDLVLMDMQMPVMSGVDAVRQLRHDGYDRPIVALTANATTEDKVTCLAAGCNEFLTKPVSREQLYTLTAKYLAREAATPIDDAIVSTLLHEEPSLRHLVETYVAELPDYLQRLQSSFQGKDWTTLRKELHDLKGAGGGYGYPMLTSLAGEAERQLADGNLPAVETSLLAIKRSIDCIRRGLDSPAGAAYPVSGVKPWKGSEKTFDGGAS